MYEAVVARLHFFVSVSMTVLIFFPLLQFKIIRTLSLNTFPTGISIVPTGVHVHVLTPVVNVLL